MQILKKHANFMINKGQGNGVRHVEVDPAGAGNGSKGKRFFLGRRKLSSSEKNRESKDKSQSGSQKTACDGV